MFIKNKEKKIIEKKFINQGYLIKKVDSKNSLNWITKEYLSFLKKKLNIKKKISNPVDFFNNIHKFVSVNELNKLRLSLINDLISKEHFRFNYYKLCENILEDIVGNELAMQRSINLSIQLPNDKSSLLTMHADTWSGDSPFEVVVWVPLVNCYRTKSMYILPANKYNIFEKNFIKYKKHSSDFLFNKIKTHIKWLNIKFGEYLIFNQSLPHGNVVNLERETRISMNCRFKGLYTPYGTKHIGDFFEPITIKPASQIGMNYKFPKI
jgi:sporadic carbohydrate cluster 2OG-Fe(II) oxygenase